jgi:hypothetical protein
VMIPFLWPLVEHFNVMAHQGAHAITATAMGFTVDNVQLDIESNGETSYVDAPDSGPRRTLTRFVGYLGPRAPTPDAGRRPPRRSTVLLAGHHCGSDTAKAHESGIQTVQITIYCQQFSVRLIVAGQNRRY